MVIKNETKKTTLSNNAIVATSFKQKAFGLIIEKKADTMIFQTRFGIHTFFMKHPIDVLILDEQKRIVKLKEVLQPNQIFLWKIKYDLVIELPNGTIKKSQTGIGDQITF